MGKLAKIINKYICVYCLWFLCSYLTKIVENVQALDLAALATEYAQFKNWWWKVQLGKCYYR